MNSIMQIRLLPLYPKIDETDEQIGRGEEEEMQLTPRLVVRLSLVEKEDEGSGSGDGVADMDSR